MGLTEKAKELADTALLRAGEFSGTAREKAPDYLDRAADLAVKAVDAAADGMDRATGGRYHDRLAEVTVKVERSLDRPRTGEAPTVVVEPDEAPAASRGTAGQAGEPITPAATNPDATDPDATDPDGPTRTP